MRARVAKFAVGLELAPWVVRWSRWIVLGVLVAMAASHLRWMIADWNLHDARYYYDAAVHLRHGENLYVVGDPSSTFRYPPWFAAAWIPLTFLPKDAAVIAWSVAMLAASAWAIWPLIRQGTPAALLAALLFGELLFAISSIGNVQPLMVGVLLWGIPRRSGPLWIALAASLKVTPLAFVLVYVARREWWRAALGAGLTVALVAPMFLYEIPPNVFSMGSMAILPSLAWLPLAIVTGGAAAVVAWLRSSWAPPAAGVAAVLCLPRLLMYDVAMLLPGAIRFSATESGGRAMPRDSDPRATQHGFAPTPREQPPILRAVPNRSLSRRRFLIVSATTLAVGALLYRMLQASEARGGWRKSLSNPVVGGALGTCFDVCVLTVAERYAMWFSWRPTGSIAFCASADGVEWSEPEIVLRPDASNGWEGVVNRPVVLQKDGQYLMWYSGQTSTGSSIGHAVSRDGRVWTKAVARPVLSPTEQWERSAVMSPHVRWDESRQLFRMWYSGGDLYEPNAIGHAISDDGVVWVKEARNPVFAHDKPGAWDDDRVTSGHVERVDDEYVMFYAGFSDIHHAQIGLARSADGITRWERHPQNPVIHPGAIFAWDSDAIYKASVLHGAGRWLLWYNGRKGLSEQIGLAIHDGDSLGF